MKCQCSFTQIITTLLVPSYRFNNAGFKVCKDVICNPETIDLAAFCNGEGSAAQYKFIGAIEHLGTRNTSGHYIAKLKCGSVFYKFNDHMVSKS